MELPSQRGNTLAETAVAVAIVAIVAGAAMGATISAVRGVAGDPVSEALQATASRELHVALDVLKYDDAAIAPNSIATSVPLPSGTPLPVQLSLKTAARIDGSLLVSVTASASDGSGKQTTLESVLFHRAVLPGSQIVAPGLAPAPTGAP